MSEKNSRGYSQYVLLALLTVYSINYMDRQIIAVLSPQIKAELGLTDTELGLLKGTAFALFYSTMSVPLAMLGDRMNRVNLITISLALWSAMTAVCGLATSFIQLFFFRMAVGIGEAGSTPPSHSLLADYFTREKRSTALAVYSLGVPIGTLLGLLIGGGIAAHYGWRIALLSLGIPGVFLAVVVKLTVREMARGSAEATARQATAAPDPIVTVARRIWSIPTYRRMVLSGSLNAFVGYGLSMWMVDFYVRTYHVPLTQVGLWMALAFGVGGGIGTFAGGTIVDRLARTKVTSYLTIPGAALILAAPLTLLCVLTSSMTLSVTCLFILSGLIYAPFGPVYGLVQTLAPVNNRSLAIAFFFLFQSMIGAGLGPLSVGIASDQLSKILPPERALTLSLAALAALLLVAGLLLYAGRTQLKADLARAA